MKEQPAKGYSWPDPGADWICQEERENLCIAQLSAPSA